MARRRFFVPEIRHGAAELAGTDAEHLVRVLRAEVGQVYEISDNRDLYLAEIEVARKASVVFRVVEQLPVEPDPVTIFLVAALIKFEHFEWLLEKATELGVSAIQPFAATRSERGLAQASEKRRARWERIVLEASQQSRRVRLPEIAATVDWEEAIQSPAEVRVLLDEDAQAPPLLEVLKASPAEAGQVALLLGPEGGWTAEERTRTVDAGWRPASLGRTILRAETAAAAGLAIVQAEWATRWPRQSPDR
jgi:16S rRNA (uracil1498-N3)-methyltransferase